MKTTGQTLRCLIVEDMEDDAKLLLRELRASGYDVTAERVDTPEEMRAALERTPWDLVVSDFSMPRFSGLAALKLLQASGHDLPFIMVSGAMGEETAVTAMHAGAHDYLLKDKLVRLGPAVERELTNAAERRKRREMEHALRESNEALEAAVAASNTGAWAVDLRTQVSTHSLIHDRMFGYAEAVPGWTVEKFLTHVLPEDRERVARIFRDMFVTESDLNFECRIRRVGGEVRWIHAQGRHERDDKGRAMRIAGLVNDITERRQTEAVDAFLSQAGASPEGDPFFAALARFLATNLQMDYICIDRLEGDALNATTLAVWHDGHFEDNLTYALKDTPCGEVVGKNVCCYPAHVIQTFPDDSALRELRAESYVGVTLFSHTGQPIGLIAVIGRQPLTNRALAETTLARVAPRAAGELERLTAESALRKSEARLNFALKKIMTGAWDLDLRDHTANRTLIHDQIFGYKTLLPEWTYEMFLEHVLPEDRADVDRLFGQAVAAQTDWNFECRIRRTDGEVRWITAAGSHERSSEDKPIRMAGVVQDITERKQAEASLRRTERALRMVSECNQELVRATSETELLQSICRIAVDQGGFRMAWVGFAEQDEAKSVRPVAHAGFEAGYLDTVKITWADDEHGHGPTGTAIRTGQPVIARDLPTEPAYGPWRASAIQHGYASSATLPLLSGERAFGALMVYAAESDAFNAEEVALLGKLAGDLAYGITALRARAERTQAERAMNASEARYRRLFESAKDGILILDAETGMIVDVNPFLIEMLGYSHEVFLGKKVWELGFFRDLVANEANFVELQAKEYIRYEDMALETSDGRRIEVEFVSNVYLVDDHKVIQCNIRDMTDRVRADKKSRQTLVELEQARQVLLSVVEDEKEAAGELRKLSAVIEQAPLSVVITDLTGAIEYVNPRFCLVSGYTPAEVLGQNPRVFKSGGTPPEVYRVMWQTLRRGGVWTGELSNRTKSGEVYFEAVVIAPVADEQGRATHYVALKDDITAKQRHEAELNAKLAREHEVSEMKTRFISVTSHEFRTPMAAAMGSVEILANHLDRLPPEKRRELLDRITSSLHRMTVMLDDILLLNRMDANRVDVRLTPVDLRSFAQNVVEEIRLGDRDAHRFELSGTGETAAVVTDPNLLHHILSNLLSNAVRYSPAGTLITLRLAVAAGRTQIAVEDQGIGVPAADRARIFEPFERGSNVGTVKGTGLGLNIVRRMTGLLGGTVALAPAAGGGSHFTLDFPSLSPATVPS